ADKLKDLFVNFLIRCTPLVLKGSSLVISPFGHSSLDQSDSLVFLMAFNLS
ncbi:hypothetical protein THIOM_000302, partial [Candidatus Thiomargarita nelsonii]